MKRTIKVIIGVGCIIAAVLNALRALGNPFFYLPLVISAAGFAIVGGYLVARRNTSFSATARCLVTVSICLLAGDVILFDIPWFVRGRYTRSEQACLNNLRQIEGAKAQWALENHKTNGVVAEADIQPYIGRGLSGILPKCPAGGSYVIGSLGEDPKCTIGYSAWPNEHVLNATNWWWTDFKAAYALLLGSGQAEKP
jgi:hypothetical protein